MIFEPRKFSSPEFGLRTANLKKKTLFTVRFVDNLCRFWTVCSCEGSVVGLDGPLSLRKHWLISNFIPWKDNIFLQKFLTISNERPRKWQVRNLDKKRSGAEQNCKKSVIFASKFFNNTNFSQIGFVSFAISFYAFPSKMAGKSFWKFLSFL